MANHEATMLIPAVIDVLRGATFKGIKGLELDKYPMPRIPLDGFFDKNVISVGG